MDDWNRWDFDHEEPEEYCDLDYEPDDDYYDRLIEEGREEFYQEWWTYTNEDTEYFDFDEWRRMDRRNVLYLNS